MAIIVGIVAQKGGVGKSTLARLTAREFAAQDWRVKIADLDVNQGTSFNWRSRRLRNRIEPDISVEQYAHAERAVRDANHYDLLLLDGAPHATRATGQIAKTSDLVIIPTGLSLDDLEPAVILARSLVKSQKTDRNKIVFALCRVGDSKTEIADVRDYLEPSGFQTLEGELPEKTGYRRATDMGKAATETRFPSLNKRAERLVQSIVDKIAVL